jgi:hypothetical protein
MREIAQVGELTTAVGSDRLAGSNRFLTACHPARKRKRRAKLPASLGVGDSTGV